MTPRARFHAASVIPSAARNLSGPVGMLLLIAAFTLLTISCGGGGAGGRGVTPPPPPPPSTPPPSITTTDLPTGVMGQLYSHTLQATGGTAPLTWNVLTGSALPQGITLSSTGVLSGTSPSFSFSQVWFQVRDAAGRTHNKEFTLHIAWLLSITHVGAPSGNVGIPYGGTVLYSGGVPPYTLNITNLPPGLTFQNNRIDGTPAAPGNYDVEFRVTDSGSQQQTAVRNFTIAIANELMLLDQGVTLGVIGHNYQHTFNVVAGIPPYTWTLSPFSTLPAGITLDSATGQLIGLPVAPSSTTFRVEVTDSDTPPVTKTSNNLTLTIVPTVFFQTAALEDGVVNQGYGKLMFVAGGKPPYSLRVSSGSLPPGINLPAPSTSNVLQFSGTPTQLGQNTFDLEVQDSLGDTATKTYSIRINTPLVLNSTALPDAMEGQPYHFQFSASDGVPPYFWSVFSCSGFQISCPPGLALDRASGVFSGVPDLSGISPEQVSTTVFMGVNDSSFQPQEVRRSLSIRIVRPLRVSSALPPITAGTPARFTLGAFGGTPPISWSLTAGQLPPGLSFNPASGEISGTATQTGSFPFTLQATDAGTSFPQTVQQALAINVVSSSGRNDSIATATPLSIGRYAASISPSADAGPLAPDNDYYRIIAGAGSTVTVEIFADRLSPSSPMDSVIEIVDASGVRFSTCRSGLEIVHGFSFTNPCINDDSGMGPPTLDSNIQFKVPGAAGTQATFFVRVVDWSGNARPDFRYEISITGAI